MFTLVSNPEHIVAVFKASKQAGAKAATSMALRKMFGVSATTAKYWDDDDSGTAAQPRKGSSVLAQNRVHFWSAYTAQTFLSGTHLQALNQRFILTLGDQLQATGIQDEWVEFPDLYAFVQSVVGRSAIETLMGPRLLHMNPDLLDDYRIFDSHLLKFLFGWRRWMVRVAYEARDRVRDAMELWHSEAHEKAGMNVEKTADEDPEFDEYFGSKWIRARQNAMMKMELGSQDRASTDVALMFAFVNAKFRPFTQLSCLTTDC